MLRSVTQLGVKCHVVTHRPLAFQRRFIRAALAPGIDTAVLSTPRGQGKSWLAGLLIASALTPRRRLFVRGTENILTAASLDQARIVFRFARQMLGEGIVRLTLRPAQCRDEHSPAPLPSASLSARNHQPCRLALPQILHELPGC